MTLVVDRHDDLVRDLDALRLEIAELRASRTRLALATDAERRAIERALHEGVQQLLVAVAANVELATASFDTNPAAARKLLAEIDESTPGQDAPHRRVRSGRELRNTASRPVARCRMGERGIRDSSFRFGPKDLVGPDDLPVARVQREHLQPSPLPLRLRSHNHSHSLHGHPALRVFLERPRRSSSRRTLGGRIGGNDGGGLAICRMLAFPCYHGPSRLTPRAE
jgi:hypothetical protein